RDGVGVGVGARIFLIFVPNDSSAGAAHAALNNIAKISSHFIGSSCHSVYSNAPRGRVPPYYAMRRWIVSAEGPVFQGTVQHTGARSVNARALAGLLCSNECRLRNFRAESSR